jgi:hypothetical protein
MTEASFVARHLRRDEQERAHPLSSCPRLRGNQYAAAHPFHHGTSRMPDRPVKPDDDG